MRSFFLSFVTFSFLVSRIPFVEGSSSFLRPKPSASSSVPSFHPPTDTATNPYLKDISTIQLRIAQSQVIDAVDAPSFDALLAQNLTLVDASSYTFTDIDYTITTPAWFPAAFHIKRASLFAAGYYSPSSRYYNDSSLLTIILGLLDNWLVNDYGESNPNSGWWYQQVFVPDAISRIALLPPIQPLLLPNQTSRIIITLARAAAADCTDANCVWLSTNAFFRGVFTMNQTLMNTSAYTIYGTMQTWKLSQGGIQMDNSFGMHGPLLYSGGYGMEYINGVTHMLAWTNNTFCQLDYTTPFGSNAITIFSNFAIDGSFQMMSFSKGSFPYGPAMWDVTPVGREIARPYGVDWYFQAGQTVLFKANDIANIGGPRASDFMYYAQLFNSSGEDSVPPSLLTRNNMFYVTDYMTHRRPGWFTSSRMSSTRTYRNECGNIENLKGWHLGEGSSFVLLSSNLGLDYVDLFPAWDWTRVPGTTVQAYRTGYGCGDVGGYGATSFVGGTSDTNIGVTAFDFKAPGTVTNLSYRKSVAFFNDLVVTLVTNITSTMNPLGPVWSTIDQRRIPVNVDPSTTDVYLSSNSQQPVAPGNYSLNNNVWWVWEGSIGYIFLDRIPVAYRHPSSSVAMLSNVDLPTVHVSAAMQTGNWSTIGAHSGNVTAYMFTLWFETLPTGSVLTNQQIMYTVVPNIDLATFIANVNSYASSIIIVNNTVSVQAVQYQDALTVAAYVPNTVVNTTSHPSISKGWNLQITSPGTYLVRANSTSVSLTVANPLQQTWTTAVTIDRALQTSGGGNGQDSCGTSSNPPNLGIMTIPSPPSTGGSHTLVCQLQ